MPLETQLIDIPFTGGLSTKLDKALVDKSRLLALQNGTVNAQGDVTRRDPWAALSGAGSAVANEIATFGSELLSVNASTGAVTSYSSNLGSLVAKGTAPYFQLGLDQVVSPYGSTGMVTSSQKTNLDHASVGGVSIYTWYDGININAKLVDESTGDVIVQEVAIIGASTTGQHRVCVASGSFVLVYAQANQLHATIISTAGVIGSDAQIDDVTNHYAPVTIGGVSGFFDVATLSTGNVLCAYTASTGGIYATIFSTNPTVLSSALAISSGTFTGTNGPVCLQAFSGGSLALLVVGDQGANKAFTTTLNTTLTGIPAAASQSISGLAAGLTACQHPTDTTKVKTFAHSLTASSTISWTVFDTNTSNAHSGATHPLYASKLSSQTFIGPAIAGRAFVSSATNLACVPVQISSALQTSIFVVDQNGNVVANALYGSHYYDSASVYYPPSTATLSNGAYSFPAGKQGILSFSSGTNTTISGISRVRLLPGRGSTSFGAPSWHAMASKCLFFSGSYMALYDGSSTYEAGFFHFPEYVTATASGAGGTITAGNYQVVALYEWTDGQGQRHQSAPSAPVTVALLSTHTGIAVVALGLQLGARAQSATVVFYRTTAAGSVFYRAVPPSSPIANSNTTVSTTLSVPNGTDTIAGNEILYTTGGALPNDNPPACNAIGNYQGRIVYNNAEDNQDWRFSQAPISGQGLYFNETLLGTRIPDGLGGVTALASMDDKLVIFTPTNKLWMSGAGPSPTGLNGSYSQPQPLTSDVGCIDQRSIAPIPDIQAQDGPVQLSSQGGLAHQTKHGYYLLTRALVDSFIGMPDDVNLVSATVTSAVNMQDKHQLRLTVPSQSLIVVYDYLMGQWATFATTSGVIPQCGVVWNGAYTFGGATGLYQDSPGLSGGDLGTNPVVITKTTAWIKLSALQGFQRVRRVLFFGTYGGPSTLTIQANQDYDTFLRKGIVSPMLGVTTSPDAVLSVNTSTLVSADGLRWQLRWHQQQQKCEAVQFVITDTPTGGNYTGVGFSGMTLEVGVKRGPYKLQASKSA